MLNSARSFSFLKPASQIAATRYFGDIARTRPHCAWIQDDFVRMHDAIADGSIDNTKLDASLVEPVNLNDPKYYAVYDRHIGGGQREAEYNNEGISAIRAGKLMTIFLCAGMAEGFGKTAKGAVSAIHDVRFRSEAERITYLDVKLQNLWKLQQQAESLLLGGVLISNESENFIKETVGTFAQSKGAHLEFIPDGADAETVQSIRNDFRGKWANSLVIPILRQPANLYLSEDGTEVGNEYMSGHGTYYSIIRNQLRHVCEVFGIEDIFAGNIDNVGALLSKSIYGYFRAESERTGLEALMETALKFEGDKGGVPVLLDGKLTIMEGAQVPDKLTDKFLGTEVWPSFNTNSLWAKVNALMDGNRSFELPFLPPKIVGNKWMKIETILGHGLQYMTSRALEIDRGLRFNPAKYLSDLWIQRSSWMRPYKGKLLPMKKNGKYVPAPVLAISKATLGGVEHLQERLYNSGGYDQMDRCFSLIIGGIGQTGGQPNFNRAGEYRTQCAVAYEGNVVIMYEHDDNRAPGQLIIQGKDGSMNDTITLRDCAIYIPAGKVITLENSVEDTIDPRINAKMLAEFVENAERWPQTRKDAVVKKFSRMIPAMPCLQPTALTRIVALSDFPAHFIERLTPTAQEHLIAAEELCEISGSLVRKYLHDSDGKVIVQTTPDSRKGEGERYPSRALLDIVVASGDKAHLVRSKDKINISTRSSFDLIDIVNPQASGSGEIITLIIRFKDNVPPERLAKLFKGKIATVAQFVMESGIETTPEVVADFLQNLPPRDLFMSNVHTLRDRFIESQKPAVSTDPVK